MSLAEWLLSTIWPQALLPGLVGLLLLATLLVHRPPQTWRDKSLLVPLATFAPLVAGLAGLVHTTEWAYATKWFWHFYTISILSWGLWWASRRDSKLLPWAFATIALGGALSAFEGWHQHFGGLAAELQMQLENARKTGQELSEQMLLKFQQTRSYGHFIDPNVYAAHLLLTCPLMLVVLDRLGKRCTSPKLARILLVGFGAFLFLGALAFSGSRGAFVGLAAGLVTFAGLQWGRRLSRKALLVLGGLAVVCALSGTLAISVLSQRKLETASVRLEYYQTAVRIFQRFPVFGAGLGEFFPWHIRLKPWQLDEARDAHSLLFAQLSQCGLPGLLDALVRLGLPFLLAIGLFRKARHPAQTQVAAVLAAWGAWNVHSLLQFNDLVIATATIAGFIGLFAFGPPTTISVEPKPALSLRQWRTLLPCAGMLALALIGLSSLGKLPLERRLQETMDKTQKNISAGSVYPALQMLLRQTKTEVYPARRLWDIALHSHDNDIAQVAAEELLRRAPHRSANWLRKWLLLKLQNAPAEQCEKAWNNALIWYPTSPDLWFQTAVAQLGVPPDILQQLSLARVRFESRDGDTVTLAYHLPNLRAGWKPIGLEEQLNQLGLATPDGLCLRFLAE